MNINKEHMTQWIKERQGEDSLPSILVTLYFKNIENDEEQVGVLTRDAEDEALSRDDGSEGMKDHN